MVPTHCFHSLALSGSLLLLPRLRLRQTTLATTRAVLVVLLLALDQARVRDQALDPPNPSLPNQPTHHLHLLNKQQQANHPPTLPHPHPHKPPPSKSPSKFFPSPLPFLLHLTITTDQHPPRPSTSRQQRHPPPKQQPKPHLLPLHPRSANAVQRTRRGLVQSSRGISTSAWPMKESLTKFPHQRSIPRELPRAVGLDGKFDTPIVGYTPLSHVFFPILPLLHFTFISRFFEYSC